MIFYEKIGVLKIFSHLLTNKPAFYWRRGLILYLVWSVFPAFFAKTKRVCKKMDYGYVQSVTNVRKNSHSNGKKFISKMQHERFFKKGANLFGIDFIPIFKIFIFSEVICYRYEFWELAMRYADEHSDEKHIFHINPQLSYTYCERLKKFGKICVTRNYDKIAFIFSVFLSPLLLWGYWRRRGQKKTTFFNNNIICNAPKVPVKNTFKELFGAYPQTRYTMSSPYLERYSRKEIKRMEIIPIVLSKTGYKYLRKYVFQYIYVCLKCFTEIAVYGHEMLRLFYDVIVGRSEAPHGKGNVFITYEHFYTSRAVRNEFIRLEGSKSILFSQTLISSSKYYFTETGHNYDFLCSSGKHLEDFHLMSMARIKIILPTGGYHVHKRTTRINDYTDRISKLNAFKGYSTAITILSCGVVDMSYNIEKKLMILAKKLAQQPGVKVFIRLKVRYKMPHYDKFYSPFAKNEPSIMLTAQEYELGDFLPVTDLFVTDISSSGCDVAMWGGQTMYVDFLKAPDFFLFWEKIDGVSVPEEKAFDEIMKWINDRKDGPVRAKRREVMVRLTEYMGYTFPDFKTYKKNLINQLSNHISLFSKK